MNQINRIQQHFDEAAQLLETVKSDGVLMQRIEEGGQAMIGALANKGKIISCGNGGSMSDAMHFAEELSGRYRENRPGLAAISCSDYGFERVFSRFVEALGQPGDILLAISTSGNSQNIILAAKAAKSAGMKVVGLTGRGGGDLAPLCDIVVGIPWEGYTDRVQELHIKVIHAWIDQIEQAQ